MTAGTFRPKRSLDHEAMTYSVEITQSPPIIITSKLKTIISNRTLNAASSARCESLSKRCNAPSSARFALMIFAATKVSCSRDVRSLLATRFASARRRIRGVKAIVNQTVGTTTINNASKRLGASNTISTMAQMSPNNRPIGPISPSCIRLIICALSW